jgi:hypothetical protein
MPLLVSLLVLVSASCSDSITGLGDEFSASAVADVVTDMGTVEGRSVASAYIPLVSSALRESILAGAAVVPRLGPEGEFQVLPRRADRDGVALSLEGLLARGTAEVAGVHYSQAQAAPAAILPATHHGKTFVLQTIGGWEIDEGRTDAPVDGVRFILYELDDLTRRPKMIPPQPLGYMDLVEEAGAAPRLRVRAEKTNGGDETLADYYLEGSSVTTEDGAVSEFSSAGFLLAGGRVDYSMQDDITFTSGFQSADIYFARDFHMPGRDLSVTLVMDGELHASEQDPGFVQITLTASEGSTTAVMDVLDDGFIVDGTLSYNGETVVVISGDSFDPTFSSPDGTLLTETEHQAVWNVFAGVDLLLLFGDEMLAPLSTLFP